MPTWDYVYPVYRYPRRQEHVGFPGTGVIIGCEQLVWILGGKPRSSTREVNALTRWAILAQDWMISLGMGSHDSLNGLHFQNVSFTVYLHETTLFFILRSPGHNRPFFMKVSRPPLAVSCFWLIAVTHSTRIRSTENTNLEKQFKINSPFLLTPLPFLTFNPFCPLINF